MDTPPAVPPPAPAPIPASSHQDRRTLLIVFGILEIIGGGFCLLMLPLTLFGQVMVAKKNGTEFSLALAVPALLTFTMLAAALIWLGIGSIQARRWARALLLCLGWMGLCCGVVALLVIVPTLSSMDAMMRQQQSGRELPPGALAIAKFFAVAVIAFIYVLIPGVLVLFYRSRHVKLTCEHRDPVERWTDRCPLPVIALCILQVYGAVYVLLMPRFGSAVPVAGFLVTGWSARVLWFGFAAFSLWAARGFYRLQFQAWLVYTVVMALSGLSALVTFWRINLLDYYRIVGFPEWQMKQLAASPLLQGHTIAWISAGSMVLLLGYLAYLRRYFVAAPLPSPPA